MCMKGLKGKLICLVISSICLVVCLWNSIIGGINLFQLKHPQTVDSLDGVKFWKGKIVQLEFFYAHDAYFGYGAGLKSLGAYSLRLSEEGYVWCCLNDMKYSSSNFLPGVDLYQDVEDIREYAETEKKQLMVKLRGLGGYMKEGLYEQSATLDKLPNTKENTNFKYYVEPIDVELEKSRIFGCFVLFILSALFFANSFTRYRREICARIYLEKERERNDEIAAKMRLENAKWQAEKEKRRQELHKKWEGEL